MHHHHSRVSAIKVTTINGLRAGQKSQQWAPADSKHQSTVGNHREHDPTWLITPGAVIVKQIGADTKKQKGSRQENAYYINRGVMIQHNAHGADADLTSNSRGPFKVFRRFPPLSRIEFLQREECGGAGGKPSGGYRKREKNRSSGRSNKARQVRWQMRNGSRFSWLRSGRESLHARTPIAPRAGDERVQLEKKKKRTRRATPAHIDREKSVMASFMLCNCISAHKERSKRSAASCQVLCDFQRHQKRLSFQHF